MEGNDDDWPLEVESVLVKAFGWSLYDIDRTDIESLIPFFFYIARGDGQAQPSNLVYCDQASWI
jgi:hypothetical protein